LSTHRQIYKQTIRNSKANDKRFYSINQIIQNNLDKINKRIYESDQESKTNAKTSIALSIIKLLSSSKRIFLNESIC